MTARYRVRPAPQESDEDPFTYFAVDGPRVDVFTEMDRLAGIMQRALNAKPKAGLTPAEWRAVRLALGFALAGEHDWPANTVNAMKRVLEKLRP
jgi:hypothetical protein